VPLTVAPRSTDTQDDRDLAQRVADLEALIKEARRRARRRRRIYAAIVLTALGAAAWASFDMGGSGGVSLGRSAAGGPSGSAAAASSPGRWVPTGGPEGGGVLSLAVDPANPAIVYAGGWGNVFKTTNSGGRWRDVSHEPWQHVTAIAIDPTHPDTVYAGADRGIGKSVDGGRHWRMVNTGLFTGDTLMRWGRERWLGGLLVDPHRPQTVYALGSGGLFRTTNGGGYWRFVRPRLGRFSFLRAAVIDPAHPGTVYASWTVSGYGGRSNLYKTTNGGDSWQRVAVQGTKPSFASLVIDADSPGTIFATDDTYAGVYTSTDGGTTWSVLTLPLQTADGLHVLAGSRGTLYATTASGTLFTSADAGATWQTLGTKTGLAYSPLAVDPQNPETLYGAGDGVVKSIDGGRNWTAAGTGLVNTLISSLVLAPGSSTTLYAGTYGGIYKTTNRGQTWQREKIAAAGTAWVVTLAVSPQRPRALYAVAQGRGLFKSSDAGVHWSRAQTTFPSKGVQAIAIDPQHPRTLYIADCGGACSAPTFQKTDDGGASWRKITGIPWAVRSLAIDPQRPNTVFAGTTRGEIFRSSDGTRSWQQVATPPALPKSHQYAVVTIAIDPRNPDNVYAGRRTGGILKSSDGGNTWTKANTGLTDRSVNTLTIDPRDPRILYASAGAPSTIAPAAVFRSTDGARTWHPFSAGLSAGGVTAFAIDPSGRTVFAATNGDGVLSLRLGS
jgi:photosystem II stability/assembly factor-like uncharacterized protein